MIYALTLSACLVSAINGHYSPELMALAVVSVCGAWDRFKRIGDA